MCYMGNRTYDPGFLDALTENQKRVLGTKDVATLGSNADRLLHEVLEQREERYVVEKPYAIRQLDELADLDPRTPAQADTLYRYLGSANKSDMAAVLDVAATWHFSAQHEQDRIADSQAALETLWDAEEAIYDYYQRFFNNNLSAVSDASFKEKVAQEKDNKFQK